MGDYSTLILFTRHDRIQKGINGAYNYKHYSFKNNFPSEQYKKDLGNFIIKELNLGGIVSDYEKVNYQMRFAYNNDKSKLYYTQGVTPYEACYKYNTPLELFLIFNDEDCTDKPFTLKAEGQKVLDKFNMLKEKHPKFVAELLEDKQFMELIDATENLINSGLDTMIYYNPLETRKPSEAYKELKEKLSK